MEFFTLNVKILTSTGCWNPFERASALKHFTYKIYAIFMRFLLYYLIILKFNYCLRVDFSNMDQVFERLFILPEILATIYKMNTILEKQDKIKAAVLIIRDKYCVPRSPSEMKIQTDFDNSARYKTPYNNNNNITIFIPVTYIFFAFNFRRVLIIYYVLFTFMLSTAFAKPIFHGFNERGLTYEGCNFIEITSLPRFLIVHLHQCVFAYATIYSAAANDTLFSGLLIQVCAQADSLKCRIAKLADSNDSCDQYNLLIRFVKQHIRLRRYDYTKVIFQ